jgi:DNA-directed RNA polymerase specialized sigma24 family protein
MNDFEALYQRYAADVFRFALYLCGNRAEAEDIASETFVRVWTVRDGSGEASADTRTLVDHYLQEDPELGRLLRENEGSKMLHPTPQALPQDAEMNTLRRTQKLHEYRRSALMLGLTLLALSSYLRLYRPYVLGLSLAVLALWGLLMLFGRRWFHLPRR